MTFCEGGNVVSAPTRQTEMIEAMDCKNNAMTQEPSNVPEFPETKIEDDDVEWGIIKSPKKVNQIAERYAAYPVAMLDSPAFRALSKSGHMFIARLAIELSRHGGKDNGALPVTFQNCIDYGIHPKSVAPAQREAEALGFCECTERGRGGNADFRTPSLWRVTFLNSNLKQTHKWRRIKTCAEAKRITKRARERVG
jgi:hypothetical protein